MVRVVADRAGDLDQVRQGGDVAEVVGGGRGVVGRVPPSIPPTRNLSV